MPPQMQQMGMPPQMQQMGMPSQENVMKQYDQWINSNAYNGMMGGADAKEEKLNDTVDTETFFFRQKQN